MERRVAVTEDNLDKTISIMPTEKQIGYHGFSADSFARLRSEHAGNPNFEIDWTVTKEDIGMPYQRRVFTLDVLDKLHRNKTQRRSGLHHRLARYEGQYRHGDSPAQRGDPGQRVPVRERGLHSRLRSRFYRALGVPCRSSDGAEHARQVRHGIVATGAGVCRIVVRRPRGRFPWHGGHELAVPGLFIAHHGRACACRPSACR